MNPNAGTMPRLIVEHPSSCPAEREYVMDVVFRKFLGLDFVAYASDVQRTLIRTSESAGANVLTLADSFFTIAREQWLEPGSLPRLPLDSWDARAVLAHEILESPQLPVLFGTPNDGGRYWERTGDRIDIHIDILGSAFFCLSRYEELADRGERDEFGRFPAARSCAVRAGFLHRPIVDEYVELLAHAILLLWPGWARARPSYGFRITHDVDLPWVVARRGPAEIVRSLAADVVVRRDPALFLRRAACALRRDAAALASDPANSFDELMTATEKLGSHSEFYFIAGHSDPRDGSYTLQDPWIRQVMSTIHRRGHVIGLHPSLGTWQDPKRLASEFATLRRTCEELGIVQDEWGGRQHYLRWENPLTWRHWDDVGLAYDSTLTYSEQVGFRCGVCREYPAYDLAVRRPLRLRERPLIVMDATLLSNMKLSHASALQWIERLSASCRKYRGEFVLLWHNNNLAGRLDRRLYYDTLAAIAT